MDIQLECFVGPVTSLTACANKLIIGCGSEITIFNLASEKYENTQQIFVGSSVHGLRAGLSYGNEHSLCVFGAKHARIVTLSNCDSEDKKSDINLVSDVFHAEDWIWDARWLCDQDKSERESDEYGTVALALAHNTVVHWNWKENKVSRTRHCTEKCILYCAHFIGDSWSDLVLAAGTVFNKIVLWPVGNCNSQDLDEPVDIVHTLSGHKGVIFSISFHPKLRKICSASDDRSIRLWKLTFQCNDFSALKPSDWNTMESTLLLCLFGHSARVWDVELMTTCFASVGEDATCNVWDYDGNIITKFKGHQGRSIWSLAVGEDEKNLFTGGGDGSVRMWSLEQGRDKQMSQTVLTLPSSAARCHGQEDFPRSVTLLNYNMVLVMMNSGSLLCYHISEQQFSELLSGADFHSYSVVSPCPDGRSLAVGSISGKLCVIKVLESGETVSCEKTVFSGKVLGITWIDVDCLVISGPLGYCHLLTVETSSPAETQGQQMSILTQRELSLPPSKHRWVTAACMVPLSDGPARGAPALMVCGDKDGSVHSYTLSPENTSDADGSQLLPHQTFQKVHSKAGVTYVCYRDGRVHTAGRDGFYRQWEVKNGALSQLHGNKILKGLEWIDRLEWHNGDLLVYGFFSSQFTVWSVTYNQQIMSVQCGGGHRSWGCCHENGVLRFVYLKAGAVYLVDSERQTKQRIIRAPLHGRELSGATVIGFVHCQEGTWAPLVCTASEDTSLSVGVMRHDQGLVQWEPLASLKGHLSSVRCVTAVPCEGIHKLPPRSDLEWDHADKETSFVLFSGGGRAELRAWKLQVMPPMCRRGGHSYGGRVNVERVVSEATEEADVMNEIQTSRLTKHAVSVTETPSSIDCDKHGVSLSSVSTGSAVDPTLSGAGTSTSRSQQICSYKHLATHFLGECRHKQRSSSWKTRKLRLDPETRVMSVAATTVSQLEPGSQRDDTASGGHVSGLYLVSLAGSDGVLRVLLFDEATQNFSAVVQSSFHKGCVLKVTHHLQHTSDSQPTLLLLSASTNGQIVVWKLGQEVIQKCTNDRSLNHRGKVKTNKNPDNHCERGQQNQSKAGSCEAGTDEEEGDVSDDYTDFTRQGEDDKEDKHKDWQPLASLPAHQSGVNSLHSLQVSDSQFLVASGGDDNAVTVQLCQLSGVQVNLLCKVTQHRAHAAQVTGIKFINPSLVVSASIDQRICVWRLRCNGEKSMHLELVQCKYSNLSDVSFMDICQFSGSVHVLCGGEGLTLHTLIDGTEAITGQNAS
ncbi:WD repeat-containing protein 6 isoform X2 [Aplysia californica]|uniref:tRNA (34-2'-O)-methyltransferase regulator WDR6 n=1 Tax=Aplysia californica TaxID=6500 RepID=A0ABM1VU99_APLCA|nr:WD repeat-containing protein 6 isoform X2 [Aplysia californica]